MKRTYCDFCRDEITSENKISGGTIRTTGHVKTLNGYRLVVVLNVTEVEPVDVCKYCALDAISTADDRPLVCEE